MDLGGIANRYVAFLGKWHWRFPKEQHSLWASIIRGNYRLSLNKWDSNQNLGSSNRSPWKGIITSLPSYLSFSKLNVKSGQNIPFWVECWSDSQPLKDRFPWLFKLSLGKESPISFCLCLFR